MPPELAPSELPSSLPAPHRRFLEHALAVLERDSRVLGVAAAGSFLSNAMDAFSDLDLVVAIEPAEYAAVSATRQAVVASLGPLLVAFTGEHVGEPRVLICLYGPPALHVDVKFVSLADFAEHPTPCRVLWERDARFSSAATERPAVHAGVDAQWIEDRFWVWVHYAAAKIGRGELFEALELISLLRTRVLGPLALLAAGAAPNGVRHLETRAPTFARRLAHTLAPHDARGACSALRACIALYREQRADLAGIEQRRGAEEVALTYLAELDSRPA